VSVKVVDIYDKFINQLAFFAFFGIFFPDHLQINTMMYKTYAQTNMLYSNEPLSTGVHKNPPTSRDIPYMTSMGSMTLPRDLLIFRPLASLRVPCRRT